MRKLEHQRPDAQQSELTSDRRDEPKNFSKIKREIFRVQKEIDFGLYNIYPNKASFEEWRSAVAPHLSREALAWTTGLIWEEGEIFVGNGFTHIRDSEYAYYTYADGEKIFLEVSPLPKQKTELKSESKPETPAPTMAVLDAINKIYPESKSRKEPPSWSVQDVVTGEFRALKILFPEIPVGHCDEDIQAYNSEVFPDQRTMRRLLQEAEQSVTTYAARIKPEYVRYYSSDGEDGFSFTSSGSDGGSYIDSKFDEVVKTSSAGQLLRYRKILVSIYETSIEHTPRVGRLEYILKQATPAQVWIWAHPETVQQVERDAGMTLEEKQRKIENAPTVNFYVKPRGGKRHDEQFVRLEGARIVRQDNSHHGNDRGLYIDLIPEVQEWRLFTQPTKDGVKDGDIRIFGPNGEIFD